MYGKSCKPMQYHDNPTYLQMYPMYDKILFYILDRIYLSSVFNPMLLGFRSRLKCVSSWPVLTHIRVVLCGYILFTRVDSPLSFMNSIMTSSRGFPCLLMLRTHLSYCSLTTPIFLYNRFYPLFIYASSWCSVFSQDPLIILEHLPPSSRDRYLSS
jgi:hypothetical protein